MTTPTESTSPIVNIPTYELLTEVRKRAEGFADDRLNIIILGPPGSGKGTHSEWLKEDHGLYHISTGDCFREEIQSNSELGQHVKSIIAAGALVGDDIVLKVVKEKLARASAQCKGFIFDGFPRTLEQAKALDELMAERGERISTVLYFECGEETLKIRICGRRIHKASNRTYHIVTKPPKVPGLDDVTGEPLEQRPDDNEESLSLRLASFYQQTKPLLAYYGRTSAEERCRLNKFDSNKELEFVKADVKLLFELAHKQRATSG